MICRNHVDVSEGVRRCTRCGGAYCSDCLVSIYDRPFCATCKTEQLLDVRSGVNRSQITYAGFWPRFGAYLIDGLIVAAPIVVIVGAIFAVTIFKAPQSAAAVGIMMLAYIPAYLFPVLYEALMLSMREGQTIGKKVLRLRVVRLDGSPISTGQAWGRAAIRLVFQFTCAGIIDYIFYFFTNEKTTLHDMVAGTRVIESY